MDVSCERCKAEYEFDDGLIGEHGTSVKCSSCGHVFRVLPASREPSRPALKLRYQGDGRIVPLSSLRDLQQRVNAGEVGLNDELGRDGFPWRKLSEVPELRSFFAKPNGAASSVPQPAVDPARRRTALSVSQSSMPASNDGTPSGKRTMLGVGPQNPQIPGPPRVPNVQVPGVAPAAHSGAPGATNQPKSATTSQGPSAPSARAVSDSLRPTDPPKQGPTAARERSVAPSNPVHKLYLSEHETAPARATESSSRIWMVAAVSLLLVIGGVATVTALRKKDVAAEPEPVPQGRVEVPVPSAAIAPDTAQPAAPLPTPVPASKPNQAAPAPAQVAAVPPAEEREAAKRPAAPSGEGKPREGALEETPKDYGGWVAKGDSALGRGDAAGAEQAYTQALTLRASGSEAATGLGYALVAEGKSREAIPYFERAAKNGYAEASIGLGDAHKKLGNTDASRKAYRSYIERLPGGSRAPYVEKQLASLGAGGGGTGKAEPSETQQPEPTGPQPQPEPEYRPAGELTEPPAGSGNEAVP